MYVDTPFLVVKGEGFEGALLAQKFDAVNVLVSAVVAGSWVALGVLVGHGRSQSIEDGAGGDIFRGNEDDGLALAFDFKVLGYC